MFFSFLFFFSPPNFRLELHLFSQQQKQITSFRGCSCTRLLFCLPLQPHLKLINSFRHPSKKKQTNTYKQKNSFRPFEVRVLSIEYCGKEMGNGSGVAFIRSTAGRYTATACATSASSSTWPMPCHRLCLSNSTLQPLISMLTVSLCHSSHTFLPPFPFRTLSPTYILSQMIGSNDSFSARVFGI